MRKTLLLLAIIAIALCSCTGKKETKQFKNIEI